MRLNRKIVVTTKTKAYSDIGGTTTSDTNLTWWADVKQIDEKNAVQFGLQITNKNYELIMRYTPIAHDSIITYSGKKLRIASVKDYTQDSQYIKVLAIEDRN